MPGQEEPPMDVLKLQALSSDVTAFTREVVEWEGCIADECDALTNRSAPHTYKRRSVFRSLVRFPWINEPDEI